MLKNSKGSNKQVFDCKMCGKCCKGKGGIYITNEEAHSISSFLGLDVDEFIKLYCESIYGKVRLVQGKDNYCIFYNTKEKCMIHKVKPYICKLWPFFPANLQDEQSFFIAKLACPGIYPKCTHQEFIEAWHSANDGYK